LRAAQDFDPLDVGKLEVDEERRVINVVGDGGAGEVVLIPRMMKLLFTLAPRSP
jgi:hypothetical protein